MNRNTVYFKQVQLLVRILPLIAQEKCFALKGGTAINLFVRDLPRLSVDIDLLYLPMDGRDEALKNIRAALSRISLSIQRAITGSKVQNTHDQGNALRLLVTVDDIRIKVELSPVIRGSVFPEKILAVRDSVEDIFGFAEIQVASLPDLYAGKICAALDRQHPRDLFDVKLLLENEGLTDDLRKTFLVYLISHQRPISELLKPTRKDITAIYENEFAQMSQIETSVAELAEVREKLITGINRALTPDEKQFLLSFKSLKPQWVLLGLDGIKDLPSVRWKMLNLEKMTADKHQQAVEKLQHVLSEK